MAGYWVKYPTQRKMYRTGACEYSQKCGIRSGENLNAPLDSPPNFTYGFPASQPGTRLIDPHFAIASNELPIASVVRLPTGGVLPPNDRNDPTSDLTEMMACMPTLRFLPSPYNLADLPDVLHDNDYRFEPVPLSTFKCVQLYAILPIESPSQDFKSVIGPFVQSLPDIEDGRTELKRVQYNLDCFGLPFIMRDSTYRLKLNRREQGCILLHAQLFCGEKAAPTN